MPASIVRQADRPRLVLLLAAALASATVPPAFAADNTIELQQLERQLEADRQQARALEQERRKTASELSRLRRESIAAAKKSQQHEARLVELESELASLAEQEDAARSALGQRHFEMAGTLAALERISRNPPQTMLAFPDAPVRMVRSAMLLRGVLPRVRAEADGLAAQLEELARIRERKRVQLVALAEATADLEQEQKQLADLLGRKSRLLKQTSTAWREVDRRIEDLAKRASSIRELLAQIEIERKRREEEEERRRREEARSKPAPETDLATSKPAGLHPFPVNGSIANPTSGKILRRYGERSRRGQTERGITFATRPGARIVAPHDGQIVFAGPFEGYGQILIIEHDGGYHTLLAGLERLDAMLGQWVLTGEPIGSMGQGTIDLLGETGGLYLELRHQGRPINPQRWIAGGNQNRTSG